MKPTLAEATPEYLSLFASLQIPEARLAEVDRLSAQIMAHQDRYAQVETASGVPWFVVAFIHALECGLDFAAHLHNGDSLRGYTHHDPAGRPHVNHGPPFTFLESAVDALHLDRVDEVKTWDVPQICYEFESFNGWGYRAPYSRAEGRAFPAIPSPYLWAGSQHYTAGKYVRDHEYSPTAVSEQIGTAVLLFRMCQRELIALKAVAV